jgi:acyl-CoA thioester hydrolase
METIGFELDVYSFHIDFAGHVNNVVYVQWMEIGRTKLLEAIGMPLHTIVQQGFAPVLVQTNITYKSPLYLGDRVRAELWLSELRQASAIMQVCFYNQQEKPVAEGWQKGFFVNQETQRPRRLKAEERALFLPYLHEADAATPASELAGTL